MLEALPHPGQRPRRLPEARVEIGEIETAQHFGPAEPHPVRPVPRRVRHRSERFIVPSERIEIDFRSTVPERTYGRSFSDVAVVQVRRQRSRAVLTSSGAPAKALKSSTMMTRLGVRLSNTVSSIVRISAALIAGIDRFTAGPPQACAIDGVARALHDRRADQHRLVGGVLGDARVDPPMVQRIEPRRVQRCQTVLLKWIDGCVDAPPTMPSAARRRAEHDRAPAPPAPLS